MGSNGASAAPPRPAGSGSVFLFSADDTDVSQRVFQWFLKTVYHNGDEVHIVHVIPRSKFQASQYAVPAVDYLPQIDRSKYEAALQHAEEFIVKRFLSIFPLDSNSTPIVHIVKVRAWGATGCRPVDTLPATRAERARAPRCSQSEIDTETVGHIIVQKAEELNATMVVMANRSKNAVTEFFMGSVSKYVMAHSKRPVLIAKGI